MVSFGLTPPPPLSFVQIDSGSVQPLDHNSTSLLVDRLGVSPPSAYDERAAGARRLRPSTNFGGSRPSNLWLGQLWRTIFVRCLRAWCGEPLLVGGGAVMVVDDGCDGYRNQLLRNKSVRLAK